MRGHVHRVDGGIELQAAAPPYKHVRSIGEDVSAGELLPTGDEIRPVRTDLATGEIVYTNSLMLAGQAREHGCAAVCLPIEPEDLPRLRYVNRQRGAGTRTMLDHQLRRIGIDPSDVTGYSREEHTHLAAAAVAAGRVRCGGARRVLVRRDRASNPLSG